MIEGNMRENVLKIKYFKLIFIQDKKIKNI